MAMKTDQIKLPVSVATEIVNKAKELGESMADMKRVQTNSPRFEPSNPLTIVRCTFDFVKSSRVA